MGERSQTWDTHNALFKEQTDGRAQPSMAERIVETMRKVAEQQEAQVRKLALELLGEETGDPEILVARLQERIRKYAGPGASLVLCEVERKDPAGRSSG